MSHVKATFVFEGDTVYDIDLPAEGKLSDSVGELRKLSGAFLTTFLATHNQSTEEVDVMEEVVDEDGVSREASTKSGGKRKGGKRKR